jgi:predicted AAA+ superfamily ATPase
MVQRKAVEAWVQIVEDLLLGNIVPVFTRRAHRAMAAHPKFFFFDSGLFRALRPAGPFDKKEEIDGAALEGLVYQHLQAWIAYGNRDEKLYYWRTKSGSEVDIVIYGSAVFSAIEVKNSDRIRPEDLRGLKAFREDYTEAGTIILYRGSDRLVIDGIQCIPCDEFLRGLSPAEPTAFF